MTVGSLPKATTVSTIKATTESDATRDCRLAVSKRVSYQVNGGTVNPSFACSERLDNRVNKCENTDSVVLVALEDTTLRSSDYNSTALFKLQQNVQRALYEISLGATKPPTASSRPAVGR